MDVRQVVAPAALSLFGNHMLTYFIFAYLYIVAYSIPFFGPSELLTALLIHRILRLKNEDTIWTIWMIHFGAFFLKLPIVIPALAYVAAAHEQHLMDPRAKVFFKHMISLGRNLRENMQIAISFPIAGGNTAWPWLDEILVAAADKWNDFWEPVKTLPWMTLQTKAEYLRPLQPNQTTVPIAERPVLEGDLSRESLLHRQAQQKLAILVVFGLSLIVLVNVPMMLVLIVGFVMARIVQTHEKGVARKPQSPQVKTGVYAIKTYFYGLEISHGIGVATNGVLHVPYHVCSGSDIVLGNSLLRPVYWNTEQDLCTYSGMPQFKRVKDGEIVYVNSETPESRTTYEVEATVDDKQSMLAWFGKTNPGESGSPVFTLDDDGKPRLVGLAGRYYRNGSYVVEYCFTELTTSLVVDPTKNLHEHVLHCGAGKTWKVIPELVAEALVRENKKVLVTGPTRVVCKEIAEALKKKFTVSYNVSGSTTKDASAVVQVCAHHTALAMIMNESPHLNNLGTVIIDEAHVDDMSTRALLEWSMDFADQGHKVHWLSATLNGKVARDTNYPLDEFQIPKSSIPSLVEKMLSDGKRVLVFVPSLKSDLAKTLLEYKQRYPVLQVSRETYESVASRLRDSNVRLIITTNIAECGLNVGDLDAVVDSSKVFKYWYNNGVFYGKTVTVNLASATQRRGRVGRTKPGDYYYVEEPVEWTEKTAAEMESDILCTGRSWAPGKTNELGIRLSDNQVVEAMKKENRGLLQVYLTRDSLGRKSQEHLNAMMKSVRRGRVKLVHCDEKNCPCTSMSWHWFDHRIHDLLVGIKRGSDILWI